MNLDASGGLHIVLSDCGQRGSMSSMMIRARRSGTTPILVASVPPNSGASPLEFILTVANGEELGLVQPLLLEEILGEDGTLVVEIQAIYLPGFNELSPMEDVMSFPASSLGTVAVDNYLWLDGQVVVSPRFCRD